MKYYANKDNKIAKAPSYDNNLLYTKEEILKFVQWLISNEEIKSYSSINIETSEYYFDEFFKSNQKDDWELFLERFDPIKRKDIDIFNKYIYETYGNDLKEVINHKKTKGENYVWTLIGDNGELYLSHGFRKVNRLGYLLTNKIHKDIRDYNYDL